MFTAEAIRNFYLEQLQKGLQTVSSILKITSHHDLTTYRDGGTGWTALEVLCHLRDLEDVYYDRTCRTVEQDLPELTLMDVDLVAQEARYNEQDAAAVLEAWSAKRKTFIEYMRGLDAAAWQREAKHVKRGMMSLQDQLALTAWHDVNHIEQMTRILAEKRSS